MSMYEELLYKKRKKYYHDYYEAHRKEISLKNHERYLERKQAAEEAAKLSRMMIMAEMCDNYCRYPHSSKCDNCPLMRL